LVDRLAPFLTSRHHAEQPPLRISGSRRLPRLALKLDHWS